MASGGSALSEFTTLMASQGPAWATGAENVINEGVKNTYTWPRLTRGKSMMDMIQGGDQIQDTIFFDVQSTAMRYNPNQEFDYEQPQTGTTWTVPWAFLTAHVSWTKHELGLNKDTTTKKYRAQRYKSVMYQKHQNLWTDICNYMDTEMWAQPNSTDMESTTPTTARVPYSIPVFINEWSGASAAVTSTLPGHSLETGHGWTNVMGINPDYGTQPKWQNERESYNFSAATSALAGAQIFSPMSKLFFRLRFDRLPKHKEYSDKTTSPHVILTNLSGMANYEWALRANQDEFRGIGKTSGQDPAYDKPTFRSVPLDYIAELDTAEIYPTGASNAYSTYDSISNTTHTNAVGYAGPRYYFVNGEYLKVVVHSENYLTMTDPITPSKQPFTRVQVADMWNNLICRSRRRQGILYPATDITNV